MAHVPADAERKHTRPSDLELPLHGCDDGIRVAHLAIRQQEDLWYRVGKAPDSTTTSSLFGSDNNHANCLRNQSLEVGKVSRNHMSGHK
jgi:hypothetical protein